MTATLSTDPIAWAEEHGRFFGFTVQLDNHEPPRTTYLGAGWEYDAYDGLSKAVVIRDADRLGPAVHRGLYLLDDGEKLAMYYPVAWNADGDWLVLHPFPVLPHWALGPRMTYHLKVNFTEEDS